MNVPEWLAVLAGMDNPAMSAIGQGLVDNYRAMTTMYEKEREFLRIEADARVATEARAESLARELAEAKAALGNGRFARGINVTRKSKTPTDTERLDWVEKNRVSVFGPKFRASGDSQSSGRWSIGPAPFMREKSAREAIDSAMRSARAGRGRK